MDEQSSGFLDPSKSGEPDFQIRSLGTPLSSEQEREILRRVQIDLKGRFLGGSGPHRTKVRFLFPAIATGLACFVGMLVWWSGRVPGLEIEGQLKRVASASRAGWTNFEVPERVVGVLERRGLWKVKVERSAKFGLSGRDVKTRQELSLLRGKVSVRVVPGKMKRFEVSCGDVSVLVRGTRFVVQRTSSWVRVEVWRGHVSVTRKRGKTLSLVAGQGVRVSYDSLAAQRYKLPPETESTPEKRAKWLNKHASSQLQRYLLDVTMSGHISSKRKGLLLQGWADRALSQRNYPVAMKAFLAISRLSLPGGRSEHALFRAAHLCKKIHPKNNRGPCLTLFKKYSLKYPHGQWERVVLYELAVGLYLQNNRDPQAARLLRSCRTRCDSKEQKVLSGRLLARITLLLGHSCQKAQSALLASDLLGKRWLRRRGCSKIK